MPPKRGRKNGKQSKSASSGRGSEGGGGGAKKKARKAPPSDQARNQVLSTSDLAERILHYVCIEDLATIMTTNKAFQEMASGDNVWRAYAQDRWPTITPMLQKLITKYASLSSQGDHGGGRSIKQYVRSRLTKSQPSDWVEKERKEKRRKEERERLRKGFEGYYFEIEVRNQLNDQIVVSSHIPVDDEKQVWALFNKELGLRLRVQDPAFTISHLKRCTTTVTLIDLKGLRTVQLLELTDGFNNAGESLELASFEFDIHVHVNAVDEEKEGEEGNERRRGGKQQRQPKMELEMYLGIGKAFGNTLRLKDSFELWKCLDACFGWIYWVDHEEDDDEGSSDEEGEEGLHGEGEFDDESESDEEYYDEHDFGGPPGIIEELLWGGGSDDGYDEESDVDDGDGDSEEEQGNVEA